MISRIVVALVVGLIFVLAGAQVAVGVDAHRPDNPTKRTTKHSKKCPRRMRKQYKRSHRSATRRCSKRHPRRTDSPQQTGLAKSAPASQTPAHAPGPTLPASTPTSNQSPSCPTATPLPEPIVGQTTIAGYTSISGGPPTDSECGQLRGGGTVYLKNEARETLQTEQTSAGEPFSFVVEPGAEYYVVSNQCPEILQGEGPPVVVEAGQQKLVEVICQIA